MHPRKWVKGENGLWSSYDAAIQREMALAKRRAEKAEKRRVFWLRVNRVRGIRERLKALLERDGWERVGNRWRRPALEA